MAVEQFVNDPGTQLTTGCTDSDVSVTVVNASGYPTSGNFRIKIDDEIMIVTSVSGAVWTVTRGAESTTAAAHSGGAAVNHVFTAGSYKQALADRNCYVNFRAALVQAGVASIGFSYDSAGPSAVSVIGTNGVSAAASFTSGQIQRVHDHFMLPTDWTAPLDLDIIWRTSATSGSVKWQIETAALTTNDPFDPSAFNTASIATIAANATTNRITKTTITSIDTTGLAADKTMYFRFSRLGTTDTLAATAELFTLRFVMRRTP